MLLDSDAVKILYNLSVNCSYVKVIILSPECMSSLKVLPFTLGDTIHLANSSNQDRYENCKRVLFSNPVYVYRPISIPEGSIKSTLCTCITMSLPEPS